MFVPISNTLFNFVLLILENLLKKFIVKGRATELIPALLKMGEDSSEEDGEGGYQALKQKSNNSQDEK